MLKLTNDFNLIMDRVREGVNYSWVEIAFLIAFIMDGLDGELMGWLVVLFSVVAAVWVGASSSAEAVHEARLMVRDGDLLPTDFVVSAVTLLLIALLWREQHWGFLMVLLLAAGQNVRYIYLSTKWNQELIREKERRG